MLDNRRTKNVLTSSITASLNWRMGLVYRPHPLTEQLAGLEAGKATQEAAVPVRKAEEETVRSPNARASPRANANHAGRAGRRERSNEADLKMLGTTAERADNEMAVRSGVKPPRVKPRRGPAAGDGAEVEVGVVARRHRERARHRGMKLGVA